MFGRLLRSTFLLAVLLPSFAEAQVGDGKPVSANPFVQVNINEENGCQWAGKRASAEQLCGDWSHPHFPALRHPNETGVAEARLQCIQFYRLALRIQNVFCSYSTDVEKFQAESKVQKQVDTVGHQNVSQNIVAADNRTVAGINKKYMEKIAKLGQEFHDTYPAYVRAIDAVNAQASRDTLREASCHMSFRPSNLDLRSPIPGFVRESLAVHSRGTAYSTYNLVIDYIRYNYRRLREVKALAEENAQRAEMNELGIPTQFERAMNQGSSRESLGPRALTPVDGAMYAAFQDMLTRGIKSKFPMLNNAWGSVIGGGLIIVLKYSQNQQVPVPEVSATFIGMWNPFAGMAANILVGAYRTSQQNQKVYRDFCKGELKKNPKVTAPELVDLWGKAQYGAPSKQKVCEESAKMAAACFVKRASLPAYSGDNCAIPAQEQKEDRERRQRIQALQRKLNVR